MACHKPEQLNRMLRPRKSEQLADFEIFRGFLATVADHFILNDLPLREGAQSGAFDRRSW